jgi:MFS family permease
MVYSLQAAAFDWAGLMAARFFIGVFEASFAPGVALYLSFFYPKYQFGLRFGLYAAAAPLASSFAGALAYALVHVRGSKIATWCVHSPLFVKVHSSASENTQGDSCS